jgi:imidazolonepropionase
VSTSSIDQLVSQATFRLENLIECGTGTLEVKSGYGLDPENELKLLRAIKALNNQSHATLVPTFLAAHALPAWAKAQGMNDASYTKYMLDECLPTYKKRDLQDS